MLRKSSFIFILALLFFIDSCTQRPLSDFKVLRFIDELEEKHISQSPLRGLSEQERKTGKSFPAKSFPLQDMGSGENPFLLKRKIKVWREYLNALFAPPETRYDFSVRVEKDAVLECGIGVIAEKNSQVERVSEENGNRDIRFSVFIEFDGRREVLFEEVLKAPALEEKQVFLHKSVDLSPFRGPCRLSFLTSGKEGAFSFWTNPVLYPRQKSHRQVILISIDTLRADHLGAYGYERETSPNIDALASDGAQFMKVYAPSPWTLPSHVSLLTALNCVSHQVYQDNQRMDPEFVTMAELLKTNGFFCSAFTGGGYVSAAFGFAEGFDSYYERTDEVLLDKAAELCLRDAARWIEQNRHKNFFLFIHTYQPHDPYACPSPYKTLFLSENSRWGHINLTGYLGGKSGIFKELPADERQNIVDLYDAEIRYTDEQLIRPLIQKLKDLSLYDQTLIVFTSDHGEEFFEHNGWGHGHSLYDESLRVPLIVKFPEFGYKGAKVGSIVSLVDVLPTILDYLRINPKRYEFDGRSLLPLLEGRERGDRTFLSDVGENVLNLHLPQKIAMNLGPLKLILNKALHKKDSAFFQYPPPAVRAVELFDLSADAAERINIVDRESQTAARILDRIEDTFSRAKQQKPGKAVLDEELKEQLRALGYIK